MANKLPHELSTTLLLFRQIFIVLALLGTSHASFGAKLTAQVINVSRENRLLLQMPDGQRQWIELAGIKAAPFTGSRRTVVSRHLHTLLAGRFITVEPASASVSGVIIGRVLYGGSDIGLRLIRSGLAFPNDLGSSLSSELQQAYKKAASEARQHKMGYWQFKRQ